MKKQSRRPAKRDLPAGAVRTTNPATGQRAWLINGLYYASIRQYFATHRKKSES